METCMIGASAQCLLGLKYRQVKSESLAKTFGSSWVKNQLKFSYKQL